MQPERGLHPLKKARLKLGYTQTMLADFAQVGKATIQRAERGEALRLDTIRQLCLYFSEHYQRPVEPQELGLAIEKTETSEYGNNHAPDSYTQEEIDSEQEPDTEYDDMMNRREAIKQIRNIGVTLVTAPNLLLDLPSSQQHTIVEPLPTIDEETLKQFEKLTETCWRLSQANVLEIVEPTLWAFLPKLATLADHPSRQQQTVAGITSQGYLLAAILAGHRDDLNTRQSLCEQALSYSNTAKDRNLQVAALRQLALTFDYKDRPRKALQTYEQAMPYLDEVSPLLRARMYAGLAGSYAHFEQKQNALRCMSLAYESFPTKPESDTTFLYADCGRFTLVLWDGLMHLELNQLTEAKKAFERIDGMQPSMKVPERVRIEFLNYQAETLVGLRDMEQSCAYLEEAVKASLALGSERRYTQASEVFQKMRVIWYDESRVKALSDLFTS